MTKKLLGKAEGVGNERCLLLGPSIPLCSVLLCSVNSHELFPRDVSQLCKWLVFLFTGQLVLLLKSSQLQLKLLYFGVHAVNVVGFLVVPYLDVAESLSRILICPPYLLFVDFHTTSLNCCHSLLLFAGGHLIHY